MGKKDIAEKALEAYNDVFADILNALLFDGEDYVHEDELEQGRAQTTYQGEKGIRDLERDESKYWRKNDMRLAFFGSENESVPEKDIPFRIIGYDGAGYRDQMRYEKDETGKRVMSEERYPVITLVLYFGYKKHWDEAVTLHEALGNSLDERLRPFVSDYHVNLFEIAYLSDEQAARFKSDFRFVVDYFRQMRKTGTYNGSVENVKHIREVLQLLSVLTKDKRFYEIVEVIEEGKEINNMSAALDVIEERGRKQGLEQGLERGLEQGKILAYYEMNLSTGKIANKMHLSKKQVEDVLKAAGIIK